MASGAVVIMLGSFAVFVCAYFSYGRFMARRIYQLTPRGNPGPPMEGGVDYVPTRTPVLFGHHFASIAGLGPILGPAVAVVWGWLPAVLWVASSAASSGPCATIWCATVSIRYNGRSVRRRLPVT